MRDFHSGGEDKKMELFQICGHLIYHLKALLMLTDNPLSRKGVKYVQS